jgi:hypothetical protein
MEQLPNHREAINFYDRYDISDNRSDYIEYNMSKLKNRKRPTQNTESEEDQKRNKAEDDLAKAWDMLDYKQNLHK